MIRSDRAGRPINMDVPRNPHGRQILKLGFLAPDIQRSITEGTQPASLILEQLKQSELPICWKKQRELIAKLAAAR